MLWACFLWNGVGPLVKIVDNMEASSYVCNILEAVILQYAEEEMPLRWGFQQYNDPKYTKKQRTDSDPTKLMFWSGLHNHWTSIEYLLIDVKKGVRTAKSTN